jgi:hypothetical protein
MKAETIDKPAVGISAACSCGGMPKTGGSPVPIIIDKKADFYETSL